MWKPTPAQSGKVKEVQGLVLRVFGVIEGLARFDDFYMNVDSTADSDDTCHPHSEQPSGFHRPRVPGLGF